MSAQSSLSFLAPSRLWRLLFLVWWAHLWRTTVVAVLLKLGLLSLVALMDRFGASRDLLRLLIAKFGYELTTPVLLCGAVFLAIIVVLLSSRIAWHLLAGSPIVRAFVAELRRTVAMERTLTPGSAAAESKEDRGEPRLLALFAGELTRIEDSGVIERSGAGEAGDPSDTMEGSPLGPGSTNARNSGALLWRAHLDDARAPVILFGAAILLGLRADLIVLVEILAVALLPAASLVALHSLTLPEDP